MLRVASAPAVAAAKAKALHTLPPSERVVRLCVSLHDVCNGDIIGSGPTLDHKVIPTDESPSYLFDAEMNTKRYPRTKTFTNRGSRPYDGSRKRAMS